MVAFRSSWLVENFWCNIFVVVNTEFVSIGYNFVHTLLI